ncbi:transcription repressor OFP15-like [Rhododendron vialii]|uniref:transcription repressor OFP15-like n=1 Tax=Rhododendron vialii TaxID=182163 RepID=UPI00265D6511|nr:transcription repressor OFP15-like [Rhododendron vialii]
MGKKMKFPFLFKTAEEDTTTTITTAASWQWPSCGANKTLSFRAPGGDVFKTMNSAYDTATEPEDPGGGDPVEAVISGLRTAERLFFEPGETSSILGELKTTGQVQICPDKEESSSGSGGGVLVAMDSMDPYADFKTSMEEMVEAEGLKEWDRLEELLGWYLKANGKENHGYIVAAFVDLLAGLAFSTTTTTTCSSSSTTSSDSDDRNRDRSFSVITSTACSLNSPLSFSSSTSTTPCLSSSLEAEDEIHDKTVVDSNGC